MDAAFDRTNKLHSPYQAASDTAFGISVLEIANRPGSVCDLYTPIVFFEIMLLVLNKKRMSGVVPGSVSLMSTPLVYPAAPYPLPCRILRPIS